MIRIGAAEFKAKCLALMDEVGVTDETIVIEKRGRPIAQLQKYIPLEDGVPQASLLGTVKVNSDIMRPVFPAEVWEVEGSET